MSVVQLLMLLMEKLHEDKGCSFSKQLEQKVVASAVFRGKKEGYVQSINQPFADTRLSECTPKP